MSEVPPVIWVHPVTLAQIRQQFMSPGAVGVSAGNVGIYAGARLFTDCRQVIGTLRDAAMESGEHTCGSDPCGAATVTT